MRLSLCEARTHQKEQHKGQPQHRELHALQIEKRNLVVDPKARKFAINQNENIK